MRIPAMVAAAMFFSVSASAVAQSGDTASTGASSNGAAAATVSTASAQGDKKICKTERVTGSLTRRTRICLTEMEWARMAENSRRATKGIEDDANQGHAILSGGAIE